MDFTSVFSLENRISLELSRIFASHTATEKKICSFIGGIHVTLSTYKVTRSETRVNCGNSLYDEMLVKNYGECLLSLEFRIFIFRSLPWNNIFRVRKVKCNLVVFEMEIKSAV